MLSVDELSHVLSFIKPKELISSCIAINKLFQAAVYHGNAWNYTRLSSRQLFKFGDSTFNQFVKNSWTNLRKFSFMSYKTHLTNKQKQMVKTRLLSILNASHSSLQSVQLHGVDISYFDDDDDIWNNKPLQNLEIFWAVTPKRDHQISPRLWSNIISSTKLVTLELMSNFPLDLDDLTNLKLALQIEGKSNVKNLKLTVQPTTSCNQETAEIIGLLRSSLENLFVTGMKYIDGNTTTLVQTLCECKRLVVLSLMYRNRKRHGGQVEQLYGHQDCYDLLCELSYALSGLKVLSLEYGPLVDYGWQNRYMLQIQQYLKSLVWVKIGQNRIKYPFAPTYINENVKCNRFCLSWNANA